MNSCDFRVFLQEFGTTVHLSLPGSVSEKERLLLKLLMQGMSVTEISGTEIAVQRPFHIKRNSSLRNWGFRAILLSGGIFSFSTIRRSYPPRVIIVTNILMIITITISSRLKPSVWRWKTTSLNRGSNRFSARRLGY